MRFEGGIGEKYLLYIKKLQILPNTGKPVPNIICLNEIQGMGK